MPATKPILSPTAWTAVAILGVAIGIWSSAVNTIVPEPYLDEVFHIRQAKVYLCGDYFKWDPKITTPPGLYVLSTALSWLTGLSSNGSLRALNSILLPSLILLLLDMETQLRSFYTDAKGASMEDDGANRPAFSMHQLHVAFNIALFPPLFFFSGLYYTDVASVISVLICWNHFLRSHDNDHPTWWRDLLTVVYGLFSLTFRQTNIFYVAIFPAAILLVSKIDCGFDDTIKEEPLLDPPVRESHLDDYIFCAMSIISRLYRVVYLTIHGGYNIWRLVRLMLPYAAILSAFVAFVVWNGSVVLGDKSNHVATIHFSQMLYLWPYILFFSWPICYPYLLQGLFSFVTMLPLIGGMEANIMYRRRNVFPRIAVLGSAMVGAGVIVHYNTIVHPFTLADNRHYMFYIFRRLTAHPLIKYAAAPFYGIAAWAVIQTLGAPARLRLSTNAQTQTKKVQAEQTGPTDDPAPPSNMPLRLNLAAAREGAPVSWVMIWLGVTALQLVSAPLVEPRYSILPWIMWRLRVPKAGEQRYPPPAESKPWLALWTDHDHRLWLETAWFILINVATGYMFLYRGFEWPQEVGKVQRFMW